MALHFSPLLLVLALGAGLSGAATAHDAWIEMDGPAYPVLYGHGDKVEAFQPQKVKRVLALDTRGQALPVRVSGSDKVTVEATGRAATLVLDFDNGIWSKNAYGSKNIPKSQMPDAMSASHSLKFGKTLLDWSEASIRPVGARLEVVPVAAIQPAPDSDMAVRVLHEGKPLAGAKVQLEGYDQTAVVTDAQGKAVLRVGKGRQMIVARHEVPFVGADADVVKMSANLRFAAR